MNPNKLHHKITFQRPSSTAGDFGHRVDGWTDIATVFADLRPMGSNERMAAMQMQSGGTHVVTVRYQSNLCSLTGKDRILFGSRTFNIVGLPRNIDERNRVLAMDVTEGGADGH